MNPIRENQHQLWDRLAGEWDQPDLLFELARLFARDGRWLRALPLLEHCAEQGLASAVAELKVAREKTRDSELSFGLSLCMIVKNEAENLPKCLRSANPYADEIIVVDTGSQDDTVVAARAFGCCVSSFAWVDDFSAARNASLSHASCPWILWLDADDIVPDGQEAIIQNLLTLPPQTGFFAKVSSITPGSENPEYRQLRIFPSRPEHRFEQRIHEQIIPSLRRTGMSFKDTPFRIVHTGYHDPQKHAQKAKRNVEMAEKELARDPHNPVLVLSMADALSVSGNHEKAVTAYKKMIAMPNARRINESLFFQAHVNLSLCLLKLGHCREGLDILERLLAMSPKKLDALFMAGNLAMQEGDEQKAKDYWSRALSAPLVMGSANVDSARIRRSVFLELLKVHQGHDEWPSVLELATKASSEFPHVVDFWIYLGKGLQYSEKYGDALTLFDRAIQAAPDSAADAYVGKAACLMALGRRKEANDLTKAGLSRFPEDAGLLEQKGDTHYQAREAGPALDLYCRASSQGNPKSLLLWKIASCKADLKDYAGSKASVEEILRREPENQQARDFVMQLDKLAGSGSK